MSQNVGLPMHKCQAFRLKQFMSVDANQHEKD